MTAKEVSIKSGVKLWKVYYITKKLGRLPTIEEVVNWECKRGRPTKWITKGDNNEN